MAKDLEDLFESSGGFGSFQKWMMGIVLIPVSFVVAFTHGSVSIQLVVPNHWCFVPGRTKSSMTDEEWRNLTIPRENGTLSKCQKFKLVWENGTDNFTVTNETEACVNGWDYNRSEFLDTAATTNGWLCDKATYSQDILSLITIGNAVGTFFIPVVADIYFGRRLAFYLMFGIQAMFTAAVVWAPSYEFHLAFRFLAALCYPTNFQLPYLTVVEFVPHSKRSLVSLISCISWTAGLCFVTLVSWILPDWRYQALICCVPLILVFLYIFCVPESPRWLLSKGKLEECNNVFNMISSRNGKLPPDRVELEKKLKALKNVEKMEGSKWSIMRCPKLWFRSLILLITGSSVYIILGIVNYKIYNLSTYSSYYLNRVLESVSDLPGNILGYFFLHYIGRRFTFIFSFFITVTLSLTLVFMIQDKWKLVALVALIKVFMSQISYTLTVYNSELFPTPIRSTAFAWISLCGFTAMTASSYVMKPDDYGEVFPYWIILGLSGTSLFVSCFLPETIGLPLPQTVQEAEDINVGRPLNVWIHSWNFSKYLPSADYDNHFTGDKQEMEILDVNKSEEKEEDKGDGGKTEEEICVVEGTL